MLHAALTHISTVRSTVPYAVCFTFVKNIKSKAHTPCSLQHSSLRPDQCHDKDTFYISTLTFNKTRGKVVNEFSVVLAFGRLLYIPNIIPEVHISEFGIWHPIYTQQIVYRHPQGYMYIYIVHYPLQITEYFCTTTPKSQKI